MDVVSPLARHGSFVRDAHALGVPLRGLNVDTRIGIVVAQPLPESEYVPEGPPEPRTVDAVASQVKMAVFDFDQCILSIHAFAMRIEPSAVATRTMATDFTDHSLFTCLVRMLVSAGVKVAIASFGRYEVIQAYMDKAFGVHSCDAACPNRFFTRANISTPSVVGAQDGWALIGGKNKQLALLSAQLGVPFDSTMFFDDDKHNIEWASEAGVRYCVHCPQGFDRAAWARAAAMVSASTLTPSVGASRRDPRGTPLDASNGSGSSGTTVETSMDDAAPDAVELPRGTHRERDSHAMQASASVAYYTSHEGDAHGTPTCPSRSAEEENGK